MQIMFYNNNRNILKIIMRFAMSDNVSSNEKSSLKESKREKFVRLAEARTNKIIDMLDLLGNCANKNIYEYTPSDVNQIFSSIENHLKDAKRKFSSNSSDKTSKFSLK